LINRLKIAFVCGSLEPGHDGVGDYVRLLAAEIITQGHHAIIVALNDYHITDEYKGIQKVANVELSVLRIPSCFPAKKRFIRAKKWIDAFGPNWVTIQFVPYAFHSKGLPFSSIYYFKKLIKKRHVHVMFHEMWVSKEKKLGLTLVSVLQKFLIKRLLYAVRPLVIHTHLPSYYFHLQKFGYQPKVLPLFSNIHVVNKKQINAESGIFRIGFFSQVKNSQPINSFLCSVGQQVIQKRMKLEVLLVGGNKNKMCEFANSIRKLEICKNNVICTDFLPAEQLSIILQSCTLGITSVPRHALGKSGSVAAFLAHGIPVAAPNVEGHHDPTEIGFFSENMRSSILLTPDLSNLEKAKVSAQSARNEIHVSNIAKTFCSIYEES